MRRLFASRKEQNCVKGCTRWVRKWCVITTALVLLHSMFCRCCLRDLQCTKLSSVKHATSSTLDVLCVPSLKKTRQDVASIVEDQLYVNVLCGVGNGLKVAAGLTEIHSNLCSHCLTIMKLRHPVTRSQGHKGFRAILAFRICRFL